MDKKYVAADSFICQNCGGTMKYNIATGKFVCSACKDEKAVQALSDTVKEYDFSDYQQREARSVPFEGLATVVCQNCGLEITLGDAQISAMCPMCASTQIVAAKQQTGIPPEGIIPFQFDRHNAQQKFRAWAKSRWFAPNDFKKKFGEGALSGMYLPFWTYDAAVRTRYLGEGGRVRHTKDKDGKEKTVTDWFPVQGFVSSAFDDVQVCASQKVEDAKKILPYNTIDNIMPYSSAYLSGYYAEVYQIKADTAFEEAKDFMQKKMEGLAQEDILKSFDSARVHSLDSSYTDVRYKHVLLPLWSSAFGYKGNTYRYLINGETGRVSGKRPYSVAKIVAAVLAGLLAVILAFYVFASGDVEELSILPGNWMHAEEMSAIEKQGNADDFEIPFDHTQ